MKGKKKKKKLDDDGWSKNMLISRYAAVINVGLEWKKWDHLRWTLIYLKLKWDRCFSLR